MTKYVSAAAMLFLLCITLGESGWGRVDVVGERE
jgi:hypothetical protein